MEGDERTRETVNCSGGDVGVDANELWERNPKNEDASVDADERRDKPMLTRTDSTLGQLKRRVQTKGGWSYSGNLSTTTLGRFI